MVVYRSNVPEGAGVFDMDIAPGIKEVTIKYDLLMLGCEKSFPDVEKLIIGEDVVVNRDFKHTFSECAMGIVNEL